MASTLSRADIFYYEKIDGRLVEKCTLVPGSKKAFWYYQGLKQESAAAREKLDKLECEFLNGSADIRLSELRDQYETDLFLRQYMHQVHRVAFP